VTTVPYCWEVVVRRPTPSFHDTPLPSLSRRPTILPRSPRGAR
jgi:hypothetical protein